MRRGDYMAQYTFARCIAEGKAAGWPDVIGVDGFAQEWADLDRLGDENLEMMASTQAQVRQLAAFKELTAAPRGDERLRRLSLAALQGFVWQHRWKSNDWRRSLPTQHLVQILLKKKNLAGTDTDYLTTVLRLVCAPPGSHEGAWLVGLGADVAARAAEFHAAGATLPDEGLNLLRAVRDKLLSAEHRPKEMRVAADAIDALLAEIGGAAPPPPQPPLRPGEPWTDAALADLASLDPAAQKAWNVLLDHAGECNAVKAGAKWTDAARPLLDAVGHESFVQHVDRWLSHLGTQGAVGRQVVHRGQTYNNVPPDESQDVLGGLAWMLAATGLPQAFRVAADLAEVSFRPIPRFGPRCPRVGTAAVRALAFAGSLEAIGQLARLELRVRTPKGRKIIKKTMDEAIASSGLSRQDVEETSVPDFGLRDGRASIPVGDWTAEIDATDAYTPRLTWRKPDNSIAKSAAVIKKTHPDDVESAQRLLKDVEGMLPAQRTRLELLLRDTRTWPIAAWRQRYLEHGLLAPMVRRLIWTVDGTPALFVDSVPQDVAGNPIEHGATAEVAIWHPVNRPIAEIVAWRHRLEELRISQPFKQAHREVYLVTDAELNTRTYSNRFAAHVVKTTVLIAIGQTRKWSVSLYGECKLALPQFGVRAEYWAHAVSDGSGMEHLDYSYGPRYLSTDQVRFYRNDDPTPMPIADVHPLAFSEVMRDVDLFVGISSVGADPNWTDGGNDRYRAYWESYSFGDLTESAKTRKQVLERLVPRLKIADRCSLTDRFLKVRGELRTYKIHLGSGNILMEPNDQYLCIVPARGGAVSAANTASDVFLPFEGDGTLSVILSKAFMLADDRAITDETITRQIHSGART